MDSKWPFFVAKNKYGSIPGKEEKLKYPAGDLSREIDFTIYIFPSQKIT